MKPNAWEVAGWAVGLSWRFFVLYYIIHAASELHKYRPERYEHLAAFAIARVSDAFMGFFLAMAGHTFGWVRSQVEGKKDVHEELVRTNEWMQEVLQGQMRVEDKLSKAGELEKKCKQLEARLALARNVIQQQKEDMQMYGEMKMAMEKDRKAYEHSKELYKAHVKALQDALEKRKVAAELERRDWEKELRESREEAEKHKSWIEYLDQAAEDTGKLLDTHRTMLVEKERTITALKRRGEEIEKLKERFENQLEEEQHHSHALQLFIDEQKEEIEKLKKMDGLLRQELRESQEEAKKHKAWIEYLDEAREETGKHIDRQNTMLVENERTIMALERRADGLKLQYTSVREDLDQDGIISSHRRAMIELLERRVANDQELAELYEVRAEEWFAEMTKLRGFLVRGGWEQQCVRKARVLKEVVEETKWVLA